MATIMLSFSLMTEMFSGEVWYTPASPPQVSISNRCSLSRCEASQKVICTFYHLNY